MNNQQQFSTWKKILIAVGIFVTLLLVVFLFCRALVSFEIIDDLPSKTELAQIQNPYASQLYSKDGKLIGKFYAENRAPLKEEDLNFFYKGALLATEDIRFYKHNGVDNRGLLRVLVKTILLQNASSGGGSTITQQLAKNLYPRKRYPYISTVFNKFREMEIAKRLEDVYSKEQILVLYSNTISFGERAFGLHTAAKRFFNKVPKDLLLEEAATLVGLLKATSSYSPRRNPERAKSRRNVVLSQMEKYEFITKQTEEQIAGIPLVLDYQAPNNQVEFAGYFKQHVKTEFQKWASFTSKPNGSKYDIYRDGLKIYTSIDHQLQIAAEQVMHSHMRKLQDIFEKSWEGGKMFGSTTAIIDNQINKHPEYIALLEAGKSKQEALDVFTARDRRKVWSWEGTDSEFYTKIDSIKHYLSLLHTGMLAIETNTGAIKAWVGGNDFRKFKYDNVTSRRQVGSTFKPFVYLAAIDKGVQPCDLYENELRTYADHQNWTPKNSGDKYGGYMTVQDALTNSVNTVSVQILFDTGIPDVVEISRKLGIDSKLNEVPSIVLGTSDISLYEMVKAYSTLANEGMRNEPTAIVKIVDRHGNVLFDHSDYEHLGEQVVDADAIKTLNGMLQNATLYGTSKRLYQQFDIDFPVMGKTGTTQNQSDGWFIGYNKDLTIGAWVGTQDRRMHFRTIGTGSGGRTAMPLVAALFEYADTKKYIKNKTIDTTYLVTCDLLYEEEEEVLAEVPVEEIKEPVLDKVKTKPNASDPVASRRFPAPPPRNRNSRKKQRKEKRRLLGAKLKNLGSKFRNVVDKEKTKRLNEYDDARKKWELRFQELEQESGNRNN